MGSLIINGNSEQKVIWEEEKKISEQESHEKRKWNIIHATIAVVGVIIALISLIVAIKVW